MNIGLSEVGISPSRNLKIRPGLFLPEQIRELANEFKIDYSKKFLLVCDLIFGLSTASLHFTANNSAAILGLFIGAVPTVATAKKASQTIINIAMNSLEEKKIPSGNQLSLVQLKEILTSDLQAVVPTRTRFEERQRIVSVIPYKEKLIKAFAKDFKSIEDVRIIWDLMLKMPNHHLKLQTIKELSKYGKKYFQEFVYTHIDDSDLSELEISVLSQLALDWKLITRPEKIKELNSRVKRLEILSSKKITEVGSEISDYAVKKLKETVNFNKTMIPFVRLYSLRRLGQEIFNNNRLIFDLQFSEKIVQELTSQLSINSRGVKEMTFDTESATIGMEIQPIPSSQEPMALKIDYQEIIDLTKYAGLDYQRQEIPFEIILTPSRSPMMQLMMLREILMITGLPIDRAGIQINFGGFGEKSSKPEVLALQRIILSAERLQPPAQVFKQHGKFWDLSRENKSEVRTRGKHASEFMQITPEDLKNDEFSFLSEIRAPVGSKDFISFARGLLVAHKMASLVKASERVKKEEDTTQREKEMSKDWEYIKIEFSKICNNLDLPKINAEWTKEDWKKFARIITEDKNLLTKRVVEFFSEVKSFKK